MDSNRLRGPKVYLKSIIMATSVTTRINYNRLLSMEPRFGLCYVAKKHFPNPPNFIKTRQLHVNFYLSSITRPNCALERRTIWCVQVFGIQRQLFELVRVLSKRIKKTKKFKESRASLFWISHTVQKNTQIQFGIVISRKRCRFDYTKKFVDVFLFV